MFARNKNNKKKRRVHYQLSYQVNIPGEVRNQKYRYMKNKNIINSSNDMIVF